MPGGVHQVAGERDALAVDVQDERHGPEGVAGRWEHEDVAVVPAERAIVLQHGGHREVFGKGVEVVAHVIEVENSAVAPEILGVGKEVPLVRRHCNGNRALHGPVVALALVAVVVSVQHPVYAGDTESLQVVEDLARPEIDQDRAAAVPDQVDVARVFEHEKTGRELLERR